MSLHKVILGFLLRFAVLYGLLIAPWPGWYETYGDAFRSTGNAIFDSNTGPRMCHFEAHQDTKGYGAIDTRITLGNRNLVDPATGQGPASILGLDSRSIGWVPVAWTIALIGATPIPFGRKILSLIGGVVLVNTFILFSVWLYIWNESSNAPVKLITLSPWVKEVADGFQYTFITQMGISFSLPLLIWILVVFRREDATTA